MIAASEAALYGDGGRGECNALLPLPGRSGPVAQWLEPTAHNGLVAGSSPAGPTNKIIRLMMRAHARVLSHGLPIHAAPAPVLIVRRALTMSPRASWKKF